MKSYAITDPSFYSNKKEFQYYIKSILDQNVDYICFRDKTNNFYEEYAILFLSYKTSFLKTNFFLHNHYDIALKLNADGVHINKTLLKNINMDSSKILIILSTHNKEDIQMAIDKNYYAVTYSPIFLTPNKGIPVGINGLNKMVQESKIKIIALGGIVTNYHLNLLKNSNIYAFASIRFFSDLKI